MNLKALDRTKLILGGLGFAAVLVGLVGFLVVVQPQRSKLSSVDDQIATQEVELANLHTRTSNGKPNLQAAELFQLSRAMPDTVDQAGIVLALAQLSERAGVTLVDVRPSPAVVLSDGAQAVPLGVVVNGTWKQVAAFLKGVRDQVKSAGPRLSVAGRLFDIDNVEVATGSQAGSKTAPTGPIQATLTLNAFVYGVPPAPTTPSSTTTTSTTPSTSSSQQAAGTTGGS